MLLHLVRQIFPNVKAVFSNTGLEYASIQRHVRKYHNVDIIVPPMRFDQVISTYGYPLISKEVAEAIYYARRIRSQNGNVERERERERERSTQRKRKELQGQRKRAEEGTTFIRDYRTVTKSGGVADRPSESDRGSKSHRTKEYSHPDEHCAEQTNRLERETDWHDWRRGCL